MYFTCELSGKFILRLPDYDKGKLYCKAEIPFSKWFGYIGEHIHETIREIEKNNFRHHATSEELFKLYPIEYVFVYKNNNNEQNKIECINDFQPAIGSGHGPKVERNHRSFNKQILIMFKFENSVSTDFIKTFANIWLNRSILMKSLYPHTIPNKNVVKNLTDFKFNFDDNNLYYTYNKFNKVIKNDEGKSAETCNTLMFMYNHKDKTNSIFINDLNKKLVYLDENYNFESLFKKTSEILLDIN